MSISLSSGGKRDDAIANLKAQAESQKATHPGSDAMLDAIVAYVDANTASIDPSTSISVSASLSIYKPQG